MTSFGIDTGPQSIVLQLVYCPVDEILFKVTVQVCQVAAVFMENTQLFLSQFNNFVLSSVEN